MAGEKAMEAAIALIEGAEEREGILYHEGQVLTGAKVNSVIDHTLLDFGCEAEETIVSCGRGYGKPSRNYRRPSQGECSDYPGYFPEKQKEALFCRHDAYSAQRRGFRRTKRNV